MPTSITHAVLACAAAEGVEGPARPPRLWAAALALSLLPDADVLGFALGVPYEDFWGHRGFFHSPSFALVLSIACLLILRRDVPAFTKKWWKYFALLFLLGASHGVLDAMTDGGLGIALLAPFDDTRYFLPWTPIPVAPIGLTNFLGPWGLEVLLWEATHIWLPAGLVLAVIVLRRKTRKGDPVRGNPA
jgi:inner membrane protein